MATAGRPGRSGDGGAASVQRPVHGGSLACKRIGGLLFKPSAATPPPAAAPAAAGAGASLLAGGQSGAASAPRPSACPYGRVVPPGWVHR